MSPENADIDKNGSKASENQNATKIDGIEAISPIIDSQMKIGNISIVSEVSPKSEDSGFIEILNLKDKIPLGNSIKTRPFNLVRISDFKRDFEGNIGPVVELDSSKNNNKDSSNQSSIVTQSLLFDQELKSDLKNIAISSPVDLSSLEGSSILNPKKRGFSSMFEKDPTLETYDRISPKELGSRNLSIGRKWRSNTISKSRDHSLLSNLISNQIDFEVKKPEVKSDFLDKENHSPTEDLVLECPICLDTITNAYITSCGHSFW
ncbi:hypothetical protein AYI68_g5281 [Smittium mucronatum]|uniref:Uncharacterized protein n=1 Tax=Smittium mucronatum TaxID=133383 RepID=A0A1R0GUU5_9FUNG|nr:hypothetical protein AYI68_g5281 [Smittium mucronatum]